MIATQGGTTMRMMMLAAAAVLAFAGSASAATGGAPYKLDAKGNCHDSAGKMAKKTLCAAPAAAPASNHCKDAKTKKFVKCGTPGAVPA
jgi:hypothetical protein